MGLGIVISYNDVGDELLASADLVEVDQHLHEPSQFRLHYAIDIVDDDIPLAIESKFDPGALISVLVPGEETACLIKGPVYRQQIGLQHGGEGSSLILHGSDSRLLMDREAKSAVWADVTDSDAVTSILNNYGYTTDVETTSAGHPEDKHTLVQRATDLQFVRRLARRNGFLFWVTSDARGTETAMKESFGSTCHGAGRVQSRAAAKRSLRGTDVARILAARGIIVKTGSPGSLAEEASEAYKDVSEVVEATHQAGISCKVARAVPLGVIKG